ncbi:MAG: exo-1,3-beta-glucanase [Thelocarpon impressellum]|nr:MAG: exo-1,3-beta-glucanase [Thelocarpon impressellum]
MFLRNTLSALLAAGAALAMPTRSEPKEPLSPRGVTFDFQNTMVQGLNLGGWLVLEPWINPSIFQRYNGPVDEYTLTKTLGAARAYNEVLRPHWDTWVTYADFVKIKAAGFNTVRIPIGYWAFQKFEDDPYVQGAASYLDLAVGWARQTGLKVWVDLHGAPGSQNGFDNSGQKTANPGFQTGNTVQHTLNVLQQISDRYARQQDVVVAIELLNEPFGPRLDLNNLRQFYRDGFAKVRANSDTPVVLHDAFQSASSWNGFLTPGENAQNVVVDHHEYQVFDLETIKWSNSRHRDEVCNGRDRYRNADKWTVVGEWTAAMTDCAPALNGYGIGARYDGTFPGSTFVGSCSRLNFIDQWDQTLRDDTRRYIEAQLDSFERNTRGWIFWNFKTEASAEWDAFRLIDAGIFPQPLSDRKFPVACP